MKVIILIFSVIITGGLVAQNVGINVTGAIAEASAMLDVESTDKGLLVPRVNIADLATVAPVAAPVNSLLVYNTNTTTGIGYYYWNAVTKWTKLVDATTPIDDHDWYEVGTTTAPDNINDDIFTNGKVGIGTPSPIYPLEIVSSSNIGLSVESTDAVSRVRILDNVSEVAIIASQEKMMFSTDGTLNADVKMTIEKFGDVGIGTTNPSTALQITRAENTIYNGGVQQITGEGTTMRIVNNDNTVGSFSQISFSTRASSAGQSRIVSINGGANNSSLAFVTEEASTLKEKMRILNNGNVGIGTTSPAEDLHINSVGADRSTIFVGSTGSAEASIYLDASDGDFAGSDYFSIYQSDDLKAHINVKSGFPSSSVLALQEFGGKVGIGLTVPIAKLHVKHSSNSEATIFVQNGGGSSISLHIKEEESSSAHYGLFVGKEDESNAVLVTKGSNVGIGTLSPTEKLEVVGVVKSNNIKTTDPWYPMLIPAGWTSHESCACRKVNGWVEFRGRMNKALSAGWPSETPLFLPVQCRPLVTRYTEVPVHNSSAPRPGVANLDFQPSGVVRIHNDVGINQIRFEGSRIWGE